MAAVDTRRTARWAASRAVRTCSASLRRMDLGRVEALGYGFQVNMTMLADEIGARIVEMPITFVEREAGQSKLSGGILTEELGLVTKWGARKRGGQLLRAIELGERRFLEAREAWADRRRAQRRSRRH